MDIKKHNCKELKKILAVSKVDGIKVIDIKIEIDKDQNWYLTKSYFADDQTVFDGEADYVGEETLKCTTLIFYCPFCGDKLLESGR